jgi:hypothetical protein
MLLLYVDLLYLLHELVFLLHCHFCERLSKLVLPGYYFSLLWLLSVNHAQRCRVYWVSTWGAPLVSCLTTVWLFLCFLRDIVLKCVLCLISFSRKEWHLCLAWSCSSIVLWHISKFFFCQIMPCILGHQRLVHYVEVEYSQPSHVFQPDDHVTPQK